MFPRANIVADIFDVNENGEAVLINRGTYLLRQQGNQFATFELRARPRGVPGGRLDAAAGRGTWPATSVLSEQIAGNERDFDLTEPLKPRPDEEGSGAPECALQRRGRSRARPLVCPANSRDVRLR